MNEAAERRAALVSIQRVKSEGRIEEQRASFAAIATAVEKAGFWKAARTLRTEADAALARMADILREMDALRAENEQLKSDKAINAA